MAPPTPVTAATAAASRAASLSKHASEKKTTDSSHGNNLYCDVCWARPNKQNMIFQRCRTCHVGVHNECYGIPGATAANPDFQCRACQAVGTTVTVRQRDPVSGQRLRFRVRERPTECCLCSVDDGTDWFHAMHPIYDHYGSAGRQLLLPADKGKHGEQQQLHPQQARLAWGHTLCCFAINSHSRTTGCVYGCTADGGFDGGAADDDSDVNSDTSSDNSDLDAEDNGDGSIHHFVFCLRLKKNDADNLWTKTIKEQQQELKCHICGSDDRHSFRIPLQCSANDDSEFVDFKGLHKHLGDDTCYLGMHVGCSIWGRNDTGQLPVSRQVFYFPGRDDSVLQLLQQPQGDDTGTIKKKLVATTVTNIFCPVHAQDLVRGKIKGAVVLRYPEHLAHHHRPNTSTTTNMSSHTPIILSEAQRRLAHKVELRGQARFLTETRGNKNFGDVRSRLGLREPSDRIVPLAPPAAAAASGTKRKSPPLDTTEATSVMNQQQQQQKAPRRHSKEISAKSFVRDDIGQLLPPPPPKSRGRGIADPDERSATQQVPADLEKIRRKVKADLKRSLQSVDTGSAEAVDTIRKQRRKHWKQLLLAKGLVSKQFHDLWSDVWEMVASKLETTTAGPLVDMEDSSVSRPCALPKDEPAGSQVKKPAEPRREATDAMEATKAKDNDNLLKSRSSALSREETANLIETILNEIIKKEEEGAEHLDVILKETNRRWRKQLDSSPAGFQVTWENVLERLIPKIGFYSLEESNWTSLDAAGMADAKGLPKWDTVEVLCLGHVADQHK